jgi:hypothetical protein
LAGYSILGWLFYSWLVILFLAGYSCWLFYSCYYSILGWLFYFDWLFYLLVILFLLLFYSWLVILAGYSILAIILFLVGYSCWLFYSWLVILFTGYSCYLLVQKKILKMKFKIITIIKIKTNQPTMSFENTQLTNAKNFNPKNLIFAKSKEGSIPDSSIKFLRIPVGIKNPDGSTGELVLLTPRVYSFGLSVNTNMQTKKPDGYTFPLCLQSREGLTEDERDFISAFTAVVDRCKEYLVQPEVKKEIKKFDLEISDLKKLNSLYYKRVDGAIVDGSGPVLYPKIMLKKTKSKKGDETFEQITTIFSDENGQDIDPMTLLEKHCYTRAAVKIESIFIGAKISLQIKVHEAEVKIIGGTVRRLLSRPQASDSNVKMSEPQTQPLSTTFVEDNDSVSDSDSDEAPVPVPVPVSKAPVRRVAAKK